MPHTVGPVDIMADLRSGRVSCSLTLDAPGEGRPLTRVNWLLRQLKDAPDGLRVDAFTAGSRGVSRSELLRALRENPALLVDERKRDIKSFALTLSKPAGSKRGQGKGSFVSSV